MKKLIFTLFLIAGFFATRAQHNVIVTGKVRQANGMSHKVWIQFGSYNQLCTYTDSVYTDTAGYFATIITVGNTCGAGVFYTKILDCYNDLVSASEGWTDTAGRDTVYMYNLKYCDPCKNFMANFTYSQSGNNVSFTNTSTSGATNFFWTFGNGDSSQVDSPGTKTYSPGSYQVCLFAQNTTLGCFNSTCKNINVNYTGSLSGDIILDSLTNADTGMVWLIQADSIWIDSVTVDVQLTPVDSAMINSMGVYTFSNITPGKYLIKAALLPSSAHYSNYLPTYYTQSLLWSSATYKNITSGSSNVASITLIAGTNPGGPGFIGGLISQGANKMGDPIAKILVLLFTQAGQPVAYTYTDANGNYQFSNLAFGSYKVRVEIPGKGSDEYLVMLSQANSSSTGRDFEVNTKNITLKQSATGISKINRGNLILYPNPATDKVIVSFEESEQTGAATLTLTDATGRIVKTVYFAGWQTNTIEMDLGGISRGIYLISLQTGEKTLSGRISIYK